MYLSEEADNLSQYTPLTETVPHLPATAVRKAQQHLLKDAQYDYARDGAGGVGSVVVDLGPDYANKKVQVRGGTYGDKYDAERRYNSRRVRARGALPYSVGTSHASNGGSAPHIRVVATHKKGERVSSQFRRHLTATTRHELAHHAYGLDGDSKDHEKINRTFKALLHAPENARLLALTIAAERGLKYQKTPAQRKAYKQQYEYEGSQIGLRLLGKRAEKFTYASAPSELSSVLVAIQPFYKRLRKKLRRKPTYEELLYHIGHPSFADIYREDSVGRKLFIKRMKKEGMPVTDIEGKRGILKQKRHRRKGGTSQTSNLRIFDRTAPVIEAYYRKKDPLMYLSEEADNLRQYTEAELETLRANYAAKKHTGGPGARSRSIKRAAKEVAVAKALRAHRKRRRKGLRPAKVASAKVVTKAKPSLLRRLAKALT